jgi:RNA polymerase sigma-70 factor, ECF subfamily
VTGYPTPPTRLSPLTAASLDPASEEAVLVEAARLGDRQAFSELVGACHVPLVAMLFRLYGDSNLAEDAAQEAFIRAWQRLDSYQPGRPFRNWLYRIAANAAVDMLRRETRLVQIDDLHLAGQDSGPEAAYESKERGAAVQIAVLALSPTSRIVLVLREYGGLSYQEISNVLDIPVGTVMSRLNYARTQLRQALAHLQEKA